MNKEHFEIFMDFIITVGLVMAFVFLLLLATNTSNRLLWASAPVLVYVSVTGFHFFRNVRVSKKEAKK